ncbi:uncharacterized protein LOC125069334 [Vanessa atalanta]|uniref:uncharacterized protein LOC125069334 n=1 Tax=Vanessa atalanta TaxID=42275 RepID=UPI001FCDBD96|nr:uncharacterized protein LOC125069334 [Vanessa atalanta]
MDDQNIQNDTTSSAYIVPFRSPAFSKEEVRVLVNLVAKYKHIILNKCTNSTTNHAKEAAWVKITKEINKQGFKYSRSVDSLKTKWENLKKEARKTSKNLINLNRTENDVLCQIVSMINDSEKNTNEIPQDWLEEINDLHEGDENNSSKLWDDSNDKQSDESSDGAEDDKLMLNRSLNFAPQECSLLLKCIKDEKKSIFCKESSGRAYKMKNNAWARITYTFNKQSPQKRTTKVLRTKFNNMKRMAKKVRYKDFNIKNQIEKLLDDRNEEIKTEPHFEYKNDLDSDNDDENENDDEDSHDIHGISNEHCEEMSDPLGTVLKGDSGIDSISHFGSGNQFENKEVVKLKLELLKFQLETAKLERQRVVEAAQAEASERQARAIETSLRLRAARLALVSAEQQLSPSHPALHYGERETRAQQYMRFPHS